MPDNTEILERHRSPSLEEFWSRTAAKADEVEEESSCPAFGYARGINARAMMIEFRFRNGNTESYPYGWLAQARFNPSVGLLLKFTGGDVVTLVLIHGSNLDVVPKDRAVNLTDRGIARHRITYVREMDENELRAAGEGQPTIDRIDVAEFESSEEQHAWLAKAAPAFLRPPA